MNSGNSDNGMRTRALIGLGVAVVLAIAGWSWLSRATEAGLERLAAIERARAECTRAWSLAATHAESLNVDRHPLADTIDAQSERAMRQCGDLRDAIVKGSPREMSGEPMPRGLR